MKVTISYGCDLEDIPKTIAELLGNLNENHIPMVTIDVQDAILYSNENNISEALGSIEQARVQLAKVDHHLLEYGSILSGYAKADSDLKMGIDIANPQETMPENAFEAKETIDDQASASNSSEPKE